MWVIGQPTTFNARVNITNYNKVQSYNFSTSDDNFRLAAMLTDGKRTNTVELTIPSTLPLYRQVIPSDASISVDVSGNLCMFLHVSFFRLSNIVLLILCYVSIYFTLSDEKHLLNWVFLTNLAISMRDNFGFVSHMIIFPEDCSWFQCCTDVDIRVGVWWLALFDFHTVFIRFILSSS